MSVSVSVAVTVSVSVSISVSVYGVSVLICFDRSRFFVQKTGYNMLIVAALWGGWDPRGARPRRGSWEPQSGCSVSPPTLRHRRMAFPLSLLFFAFLCLSLLFFAFLCLSLPCSCLSLPGVPAWKMPSLSQRRRFKGAHALTAETS